MRLWNNRDRASSPKSLNRIATPGGDCR